MTDFKLTQYSKGGGCGCKIAPSVLQEIVKDESPFSQPALLVGNASNDDAAVYRISENQAIISTTDFFLPIVNDPFDFGRIAAANAISDVYAMGGTPLMAIAILGWPIEKIPPAIAAEVLRGGREVCAAAGIPLAGGHTIDSNDPIFGLSVSGTIHPAHLKRNDTARTGDLLYLTKALGVGILTTALKRELLESAHYENLIVQLTQLNKIGELFGKLDYVHAMTDVTGFGLLGHAFEMADGSNTQAEIFYSALKKAEGLEVYLKQRIVPDATSRNWSSYQSGVQFAKGVNVMEAFNLLPDPQTNGGLLVSIAADHQTEFETLLRENGLEDFAKPIGRMNHKGEKTILVSV